MKKIILALSVAASLAGLPSFAFAAPAADPQTTAAVKSLLDAMDFRKGTQIYFAEVEKTMPAMLRQQMEGAIRANPTLSPEKKRQALAKIDTVVPSLVQALHKMFQDPTLIDAMITEMVPLYANNFTTAEINELAVFYRTPLGRKMMAVMPKVTAESMAVGQKIVTPRLGKLMQDVMQGIQKQ